MRAVERLRKALGYLDHLEFGLADKLTKVRNVQTLVRNSIKEVEMMQKRLDAYDTVIKDDLKHIIINDLKHIIIKDETKKKDN